MERPVNEGVYEWSRPKRVGQVVRHYITSRHGLVEHVDGAGRMKVCVSGHLGCGDTVAEGNAIGDPTQASAIFPNGTGQGIWWPDFHQGTWYLMADGTSIEFPEFKPLRKSRRSRSTTPGTRRTERPVAGPAGSAGVSHALR